jgi:hypothetical protein
MNPYIKFYENQVGSGISSFQGARYQRGHGFFGRLFSSTLLPFIKQLLPAVGKRVLPSAVGLAQDIMSGENVGRSTLNRLGEAGRNVADETLDQIKTRLQKGSGRKRKTKQNIETKKRKTNKKSNAKKNIHKITKRKTKSKDDFDFLK